MTNLVDDVDGILHPPTQVHEDGTVDLTIAEIYEVDDPGRVDFGGDELEPATVDRHPRVWRNGEDDHQWWNLESGTHLIEFNESLSGPAFLQPRTEILERGGTHPSLRVEELRILPLTVGGAGLRLKENARVSTLQRW